MYITASTYGGVDWHDSRTIYEQLKSNGSYNIGKEVVPEVIADDIARDFPYMENIREKILQALSEKNCFRFAIKTEETDSEGKITYKDCESCEMNGQTYLEQEAVFDGSKLTFSRDYAFGQVSYITSYYVEDIVVRQIKRGCFRQIKTVRQEASGKHPVTLLSVYLAHWKKQQTTHAN